MDVNDIVKKALQQAAVRAERHALLDGARASIERNLGYALPAEILPWGSALSMS